MYKTRVTSKGQTVVPAPIRKKFNMGPKSRLVWSVKSNVIEVTPLPVDPIKFLRGFTEDRPLRPALLRRRREDKTLE
jgi:AbrB family looped-hinge helix DNA binding protein